MGGAVRFEKLQCTILAINVEEILRHIAEAEYSSGLIYSGLFITLILCGLGLPIPEDIPLIAVGLAAAVGTVHLKTSIFVAMAGVLIGDTIIYYVGYHWGLSLLNRKLVRRVLPEKRLERVRRYFNRYGNRTIFFARFIVGLRAATFWAAGTLNVRYGTFLLFDGLAALISVPAFVYLGWYFGDNIDQLMPVIKDIKLILLLVAMGAIGFFIYWEFSKKRTEH